MERTFYYNGEPIRFRLEGGQVFINKDDLMAMIPPEKFNEALAEIYIRNPINRS